MSYILFIHTYFIYIYIYIKFFKKKALIYVRDQMANKIIIIIIIIQMPC